MQVMTVYSFITYRHNKTISQTKSQLNQPKSDFRFDLSSSSAKEIASPPPRLLVRVLVMDERGGMPAEEEVRRSVGAPTYMPQVRRRRRKHSKNKKTQYT